MYADYDFYKSIYGGKKVTAEEYGIYESRAEDELNYIVNYRIDEEMMDTWPTLVAKATCALVDAIYNIDKLEEEKPIQSVSSGGESYSYANTQTVAEKAVSDSSVRTKYFLSAVRPYLARTGLLYQGV